MAKKKRHREVDYAEGVDDMERDDMRAEIIKLRMITAAGIDKYTWEIVERLGEALHQPSSREWRERAIEAFYLLMDNVEKRQ